MKERLRRILEISAIVTGISGITISNLRDSFSVAFYSALILLVLITFISYLSIREDNLFRNKPEIEKIWRELLIGASRSVKVFAGDVSWANRDKEVLSRRIDEGATISVLCRRPHNDTTTLNVVELLNAGVQVKYYQPDYAPSVRGLIIDTEEKEKGTALTVYKSPKARIVLPQRTIAASAQRGSGVPGDIGIYQYEGRRYLPSINNRQIQILGDLFTITWRHATLGVILQPLKIDKSTIIQMLRTVSHYKQISWNNIKIEAVDIQSLWASCTYVREEKLNLTQAVCEAFRAQKIPPFTTCVCLSHIRKSILLPPIIEVHKGKSTIIDGTHRLFFESIFLKRSSAICITLSTGIELPSDPIPFNNIKIWPEKLPKDRGFNNFRPELFRDIDSLDRELENNLSKYVGEPPRTA